MHDILAIAMTPALALVLALALTQVPVPLRGAVPAQKPHNAVSGTLAWEQALASPPSGPPRIVSVPGADTLLLLPLNDRVEARRAADGALAWTREGLAGTGLAAGPPVAGPDGPVVAWAGTGAEGGVLLLLRVADGTTARETTMPAPPTGAPAPAIPPGEAPPDWIVPIGGSRVAVVDGASNVVTAIDLGGEVAPPAFGVLGRPAAVVREPVPPPKNDEEKDALLRQEPKPGTLLSFNAKAPRRRLTARDIDPASHLEVTPLLFAAGVRSFAGFRCHDHADGTVSCRQRWRQRVGGSVLAPPIATKDAVLVASLDNYLYAFLVKNGHLAWRTYTGARLQAPPIFWSAEIVAVLAEASSRVLFFDTATGRAAGKVEGPANDVFVGGIARTGDALIVPALAAPQFTPVLRAYQVKLAPEKKKEPAEGEKAPAAAPGKDEPAVTPEPNPDAPPSRPEPPAPPQTPDDSSAVTPPA